jgi:nucleotide-binding universal stress UspA family protein
MMLKIVVGCDGSQPASAALDAAIELFPRARATLAHFWSSPIGDPEIPIRFTARARSLNELIEIAGREGAERADRLAAEAVADARAAGWDAEQLVRRVHGGVGFELARTAEELDADLIVVGGRGLGGARAALGSVSDLVVHVSTVPVLVVSRRVADANGSVTSGPVLVGYDGSEGSRRALAEAGSLFAGRQLLVATVEDGDEEQARRDLPAFAGLAEADFVVIEGGRRGARSVADALSRRADESGASVVVVGSRGRSAAREILLGSTAMGVLHHGTRPVLIVPGRRFAQSLRSGAR